MYYVQKPNRIILLLSRDTPSPNNPLVESQPTYKIIVDVTAYVG